MEFIEERPQSKDAMEAEAAKVLSKLHSVGNENRMYALYDRSYVTQLKKVLERLKV